MKNRKNESKNVRKLEKNKNDKIVVIITFFIRIYFLFSFFLLKVLSAIINFPLVFISILILYFIKHFIIIDNFR